VLRSIVKQSVGSIKSALKKKKKAMIGRICRKGRFKPVVKECGVMDDESGELMELMEEVPVIGLGESELERLVPVM